MRPRLAICSPLLDVPGAVEVLCLPYDDLGVEFRIDAHRIGNLPEQVDRVKATMQRCDLADFEMRFHFPRGPFEIAQSDDDHAVRAVTLVKAAMGHIAETDCHYLTVHLPLPDDASPERFGRGVDLLGELVRYGAERNIRVCLENLRWGLTSEPEHFLELVEASGAGITFNVGHANSSDVARAGFSAARFAAELGDRIEHVHVYGRQDTIHHPPSSIEEIRQVVDALLATRCEWWTIELFGVSEAVATRDMLQAYFDSVHLGLRRHPQPIR